MSALARIFGSGKKGETQPSPQVAIQKLRETAEMLEARRLTIRFRADVVGVLLLRGVSSERLASS